MRVTQVSARWTGEELNFVGLDHKDREVAMGQGHISPGNLMLIAAAGCMGMDVVHVLKKKHQNITDVEVQLTAHQPDAYPKAYQIVDLAFTVKGHEVDPNAVERAISLSRDKYCTVNQTLKNAVEIRTSFTIQALNDKEKVDAF